MSPPGLSRMIRQDTTRPSDRFGSSSRPSPSTGRAVEALNVSAGDSPDTGPEIVNQRNT